MVDIVVQKDKSPCLELEESADQEICIRSASFHPEDVGDMFISDVELAPYSIVLQHKRSYSIFLLYEICPQSQDSSVGMAVSYRMDSWGLIPSRDMGLLCTPQHPDWLSGQPDLLSSRYWELVYLRVKAAGE
jgi:hypothetical protein